MRMRNLALAFSAVVAVAATSSVARAMVQPRDYMLDPPKKGLWAHGDLFTVGGQASLEHRYNPEGDEAMSQIVSRVSGLASLGYADLGAHLDARLLIFTVGASVGYRRVWRNYSFGEQFNSIAARREVDAATDKTATFNGETVTRDVKNWPWAEARARMVIPLEHLWWVNNFAIRFEGAAPYNSYDWFHTNVHDGGTLYRFDSTLFFRHERFGGLGPTFRYMDMPRRGERKHELAGGFTFVFRPGIKRTNDIVIFQFLTIPKSEQFGFHLLKVPVYAMLIYRASFQLL